MSRVQPDSGSSYLRPRLTALMVVFLLINLLAWWAGERVFIDEARRMDRERAVRQAKWIDNLLAREVRNLQRVLLGRADRLGRDPLVQRSGLAAVDFNASVSEIFLAGANIDAFLIENDAGKAVYGCRRDSSTDALETLPQAERRFLSGLTVSAGNKRSGFYGLAVAPDGSVAMVAGMPVFGTSRYGWLIARRDLNARQIETYGEIVDVPFEIRAVVSGTPGKKLDSYDGVDIDADGRVVRWLFGDLAGRPVMQLSMGYNDDYEQHMARMVAVSRSGVFFLSLAAGVLLLLLIRHWQLAQRRAEASRQEVERMARLAAVGELAAGVAHEINNPNGMIQRNLEFVGDVINDALPLLAECDDADQLSLGGVDLPMAREQLPLLLDDMVHGSRRISEIVRDLKDFARDDGLDDTTVFDLNEAVSASVRLLDGTIRKATDAFRLSLGNGLPPVSGNLRQIEQVVLNLLQNACQALPSRDRAVAVATCYDASRRFVIVEVIDEGMGMDGATLEKIFDPFFTTRRESGGTGLGLAVSQRIVRRHGGKLTVVSTPGRGTTLTLTLPVSQEKP